MNLKCRRDSMANQAYYWVIKGVESKYGVNNAPRCMIDGQGAMVYGHSIGCHGAPKVKLCRHASATAKSSSAGWRYRPRTAIPLVFLSRRNVDEKYCSSTI